MNESRSRPAARCFAHFSHEPASPQSQQNSMPLRFTAHVMKGQPAPVRFPPLHPSQRLVPFVWNRGHRRHDRPQMPIPVWVIERIPLPGS